MRFTNIDLRKKLQENGVYQYELAKKLGMSAQQLSCMLYYELAEDEKKKMNMIVEEIIKDRKKEEN